MKERSEELSRECENLRILHTLIWQAHRNSIAKPIFSYQQEDAFIFAQTCLEGFRLKNMDRGRAFSAGRFRKLLLALTDWLLEFHRAGGAARAPLNETALEEHIDEPLRVFKERFSISNNLASLLTEVRDSLHSASRQGEPMPRVFVHGDLSAANILVSKDDLRIIDWEHPLTRQVCMSDLVHFMASCRVIRTGSLSREEIYRRNFQQLFFNTGAYGAACRIAAKRYLDALGVAWHLAQALYVMAWITHANRKAQWLETREQSQAEGHGTDDPNSAFPVTFFEGGSVMNLELLAEDRQRFVLQ
ncbi:phosphotransferase family protein [Acidobacteriota bacterium]